MSEVAKLYAVPENNFKAITSHEINPLAISIDQAQLKGSVQALMFLLNKILLSDEDTEILINAIFYPDAFIGEPVTDELDFSTWSASSYEALGDAIHHSIHYQSPRLVAAIDNLLAGLDEVQVADAYDAEELNENDIYPGTWSDDVRESKSFNMPHLVNDFLVLKEFIHKACKTGCYVLCYAAQ
ncbi:protein of unknown function [Chitinophaga costaii]|uniref:DUF1877 family protein n=1 Tax=Chitinophaga costaii TaxID=1335309 RepID=A0A1C4G328_9BACT|nr:DUF1877 family protein [Chitinophaga costaii]PUZ20968.1 DUF1877 domain-containing protein [Chitinophaga costaii]SCC62607.1 protein of unknown function [Chitinophaga costaii]